MPIRFSDTHICEKCNEEFEWIYFEQIRTRFSDIAYVNDSPPANRTLAYTFQKNKNHTISIAVNCPYCDYDNQFIIDEDLLNEKQ